MLTATLLVAAIVSAQPAPANTPAGVNPIASAASPITLTPTKVTETREKELQPPRKDEDGVVRIRMSGFGSKPGLRVTLSATTPKGQRILEVQQPETVKATDSAKTDLSEIEEGFGGDKQYLELEKFGSPFDEDRVNKPQEVFLTLGMPARKATSFSVSAACSVLVGGAPKAVPLPVAKAWTKLEIPEFDGVDARYRVKLEDNTTEIEFKSDAVKSRIEEVMVVRGSERTEANGWSSMNGLLSYSIDAPLGKDGTIELRVFSGVKVVPLKIDLKDVALP